MTEEDENTLKISVPLITDEEIRRIDNNFESIVNEFLKLFIHDKDLAIAQHIIQKQQEEIESKDKELKKKDKIIDLMAECLEPSFCFESTTECNESKSCKECIRKEFEKKVR